MIEDLGNGSLYISKGTPFPFLCPKCQAIIRVASLDGQHSGADRYADTQNCWNCKYIGLTEEFDCDWQFRATH